MKSEPLIIIYKTPCNLLDEIAKRIMEEGKNDLSNIAIVFPNKRPYLYLKKILSEKIKNPFIPPSMFSLQEFAFKILNEEFNYQFIDLLDAVYILKNIFDKENITIFKTKKFSDFFSWGVRIIKAIDELEMNNVNFKEVKMLKEYAEVPQRVKELLEIIDKLRDEFYNEILSRNKITRGLLFRKLKEIDFNLDFEKVIFAGFYALLPFEEYFIKKVISECNTEMLFIKTRESRAIYDFINRNNFAYKVIKSEGKGPKIEFIKLKDFYSQAIFLREKLKEILKEEIDPVKVGCILPDPSHLEPLLGELGTELKTDFNVSMGYSFRLTPSFSFIKKFFELKKEIRESRFYYKTLLSFLNHPFIVSVFPEEVAIIEKKIRDQNQNAGKIYFDISEIIEERFNRDFVKIFSLSLSEIKKIKDFISVTKEILNIVYTTIEGDKNILLSIFLKETFEIFEKILKTEISEENIEIEDISKILFPYLSSYSIPLRGDPLRGFQIIGVLEARLVPFEKVFFLDLLEGIYPKSYKYDPVLPESLRKILGLPSYRENEAIYAYNFYQIVENAKDVYLLFYETEKDIDSPESRFIQRLLWEKEKREKRLLYDEIPFYTYNPVLTKESKKIIEKDEKITEILYKKAQEGFHVTEIDEYIKCPFRFYQSKIIKNIEEEEITEDIESKSLGTFLHKIMEEFYKDNFMNKVPEWSRNVEEKFLNFFSEKFDEQFGKERESLWLRKEYLILKMKKFINKLKRKDKGIVRELEYRVNEEFQMGNDLKVRVKGKIDRVNEIDGYYKVIDYKSSSSDVGSPFKPENLEDRREIAIEVRSLQVPIYALVYSKKKSVNVREGAYYIFGSSDIRSFRFGGVVERGQRAGSEYLSLEDTEVILRNILKQIFDKSIPFEPDSRTGSCGHCPYKGICGEF